VATVTVHYTRCRSDEIYRHGRRTSQHERFRCRSCKCVFQLTYTYEAWKPGVKKQIVDMARNGSGVHDIARTLKITPSYVL
jgi:transposase-like protein